MAIEEIDKISELKELASIFGGFSLYAVGGMVRNALLDLPMGDIDIASELPIDKVKPLLDNTRYAISAEYPRTGTLVIAGQGFKAEYTTFREDSYPVGSGAHAPESVVFTDDIVKDALRRDFTINAVYYDLARSEIVDPLNGKRDIENKLLRTVDEPVKVMGQDALRLMRLIRFGAELGFNIESETYSSISVYAPRLKEISKERIVSELFKTIEAERKYPRFLCGNINKTLPHSLSVYRDNGLLKAVLGIDNYTENVNKISINHGIIERLASIYCDTPDCESVMIGLNFPKRIIKDVIKAVSAFRADKTDVADFIAEHIEGYSAARFLCDARDRDAIDRIINKNVPTRITELQIDGNDAIAAGYRDKGIADALGKVLRNSIRGTLLTREEQLKELYSI